MLGLFQNECKECQSIFEGQTILTDFDRVCTGFTWQNNWVIKNQGYYSTLKYIERIVLFAFDFIIFRDDNRTAILYLIDQRQSRSDC